MLDSGFVEFKLDYSKAKDLAIGDAVYSGNFSAGGHVWRIQCYPRGNSSGEYLSLYLELVTQAANVTAVFDAFLLRADGAPSPAHQNRCVHAYPPAGFTAVGWRDFARLSDLGSPDLLLPAAGDGGSLTFLCGVIVLRGAATPPAPATADVASHVGRLLDGGDGSDVALRVGGETFRAHRAVLAARSPVLKAELLGSMAEATMPTITLRDMDPDTFGAMLRFIYTDALPEELGKSSSPAESLQALIAAADRYALDMLKLMCAQRLCDVVSVDNVAAILVCSEVFSCPELKSKCLDFFVEEKNFKKVVLTQGYLQLIQSFPSLVDEIRTRVEDQDRRVLQQKTSSSFSFSVIKARYLDPWIQMLVDAMRN